MTIKGLRERGYGESKGRVHTSVHSNPFLHYLYATLVCARGRDASRTDNSGLPKKRGRKKDTKVHRYEGSAGLAVVAVENRGRRAGGEAAKKRNREGNESTAVSLRPTPSSSPHPARSDVYPRPNYRARRATPTVHVRNLHPTSISSRRSAMRKRDS